MLNLSIFELVFSESLVVEAEVFFRSTVNLKTSIFGFRLTVDFVSAKIRTLEGEE